jgi:hypothetical protein
MRTLHAFALVVGLVGTAAAQQEKPVPKDSIRISIPGCPKGVMFTVTESPEHESRSSVPPGRRFRLSGKKELLKAIKEREGGLIEVTGLIRKGQLDQTGVALGGGVSVSQGPTGASAGRDASYTQVILDVEGWRPLIGDCPLK